MKPEWIKLWRRDTKLIDNPLLDMESRGIILTNLIRYHSGEDLLPMSPQTEMAFLILKRSVDDAVEECERRSKIYSENGSKGGRPRKADKAIGFSESNSDRIQNTEDRIQKIEDRIQNTEDRKGKEKEKENDPLEILRLRLYG